MFSVSLILVLLEVIKLKHCSIKEWFKVRKAFFLNWAPFESF